MQFKPRYVPKKRKWSYKIVVPFILLTLGLSYFGYKTFWGSKPNAVQAFTVCDLSVKKTKRLLNDINKDFMDRDNTVIRDYSIYGEVLKFYQNEYTTRQDDPLIGKMLYITDICKGKESAQTLISTRDLDSGIDFSKLEDGMYTLEILGDIDPSVLVADVDFDYEFESIMRDGKIKVAHLFAKQSFYENENNFDKNYVMLEVRTVEENDAFDIILDPSAGNTHNNGTYNWGHSYKSLNESTLMYELALGVESILKDHGLRVLISRDENSGINYYGESGRIKAAYDGKAKYYIHMRVETSGSNMDRGLLALYSNYTSNRFAQSMIENIKAETGFQTSPYVDKINIPGVYQTNRNKGLDNNDFLRETGGVYTGAGVIAPFDELMSFAKSHKQGMYGVNILYGYLTDATDYAMWQNDKAAIIKGSAKGILEYLGIEYIGD